MHYIMAEKPWIVPRPPMESDILLETPPSPSGSSTVSITSDDNDSLSMDSDSLSTPATSPSTSQLDVRLRIRTEIDACSDEDDAKSIATTSSFSDADYPCTAVDESPGPLDASWMGESEEELLRWWWAAFDRLELEASRRPWWTLVEASTLR